MQHYLWRAVDQHGDVLDVLVQPRRNAQAAKKFFRKLLKGPSGAAELDPPGGGRSRGARRPAVDGDDRGGPAPGPGGRGAAAGERGAAGGERVFRCED
ncbi:DDE-type integrase/transposase/recombinase [Rhodococcus wratislaviensis]|uniref:DDE-type integrase/transposase/recombinase n=1 Tax=Rhodococcus wratislaviensis TaxID=44752 RepID=UPI0037C7C35F